MFEQNPYPWSQCDGLCRALRDSAVWGAVIADIGWRHHFKRVIKRRSARKDQPLQVTDSVHFAEEFMDLLASHVGREDLAREFERNQRNKRTRMKFNVYLGRHLHRFLLERHGQQFPDWTIACDKQQGRHYLSLKNYSEWLERLAIDNDEAVRLHVLYGCAFALLQPNIASEICNALRARDAAFNKWTIDDNAVQEHVEIGIVPEPLDIAPDDNKARWNTELNGASAYHGEPPQPVPFSTSAISEPLLVESAISITFENEPNDSERSIPASQPSASVPSSAQSKTLVHLCFSAMPDELVEMFRDYPDWISQVPLARLRQCIELLRDRADQIERQLRAIDEQRSRVSRQIDEAVGLPWMSEPFDAQLFNASDQTTILDVARHLTTTERDVARLLQAHVQLEALTARLGRSPRPLVPRGVTSVIAVADCIEACVEEAREELRRINVQESRASEFFERFSTADRRVAESLVREIPVVELESIALFVARASPRTDGGRRYARVAESTELLGPVMAYLVHRMPVLDESTAISEILLDPATKLPIAQRAAVLSHITFADLQNLSEALPNLTPEIAEGIFAAAIVSNKAEQLDYLEPFLSSASLHPACEVVYRVAVGERRRGIHVDFTDQLRRLTLPASATAGNSGVDDSRRHLLDLIHNPPGMRGNFHRLRAMARVQYFLPLKELVERGDVEELAKQWDRYGSLDDMVEHCVRSAKHIDVIDRAHRQQTRNYLATFGNEIQAWRRLQSLHSIDNDDVANALKKLRIDAASGRSVQCATLLATLECVRLHPESRQQSRSDFGQRCEIGPDDELSLRASPGVVSPLFTWSYPHSIAEGLVPLWRFIADSLRSALGVGPNTLEAAVNELLSSNELLAARCAASGDAKLERLVAGEIDNKRSSIRAENLELLAQAQAARIHDEYIELCIVEFEEALNGCELEEAVERLRELHALVRRYYLERDPRRRALAELLAEAGKTPSDDASAEELERQFDELRIEHQYRRLHLHTLSDIAEDSVFPLFLREAWSAAARRLDRPALWPSGDTSIELAESIDIIVQFMRARLHHREVDPATVDLLIESLEDWIPARLKDTLEQKTTTDGRRSPIIELSSEIRNYCPDRRILQILGEAMTNIVTSAPQDTWQTDSAGRGRYRLSRSAAVRGERISAPRPVNVVAEIRSFLKDRAEKEPAPAVAASREMLRESMRRRDWQSALRIAGELAIGSGERDGDRLSEVEVAYAICLVQCWPAEDRAERARALHYGCLAALHSRDVYYFVTSNVIDELVARAMIALVAEANGADESPLSDSLAKVLASLPEATPLSSAYQWLSELMSTAGAFTNDEGVPGSARLALQLWEALKGHRDVAKPRCDLIHALYRMRQIDVLRYLARGAKPLDELIIACITAFERAESDPEVRGRTSQIAAAVREQARGKPNTKPWTLLLARIEPTTGEGTALRCAIDADRAEEEIDGTVTIPLRVCKNTPLRLTARSST